MLIIIPGFDILAEDLTLSASIVVTVLIASLVGGWVFSSAVSENSEIRGRMASIFPWRMPPLWTIFVVVFYPAMILFSWGISLLFGMDVAYPGLWDQPKLNILPLYLLTFSVTLLIQDGNEEIGWRGFMQPELQKIFNPLITALIVFVFWSLWHLPYSTGNFPCLVL